MMLYRNRGDGRSVPEVLQDIAGNVENLARSEVLLAKTQIKEQVIATSKASRSLALGVFFGCYALGFALLTVAYALSTVINPWLAALTVSLVVGLIAGVLVVQGRSKLKAHLASGKSIAKLLETEEEKWSRTQN